MSEKILKHIVLDERNYLTLKRLGNAGDSFNDVISRLLKSIHAGTRGEEERRGHC
jgi:predicted CopG family antitoxin